MRKRYLYGIVMICLIFSIMACGSRTTTIDDKDINGYKVRANNVSVIGTVVENTRDLYVIRLMGSIVNGKDGFLLAENREEAFEKGDEVIVSMNGSLDMVDDNKEKLEFDTVNQLGEYVTNVDRILYIADIDKISLFENDGIFEGVITGIYDCYDESGEIITATVFEISPGENEPEVGSFMVDVKAVDEKLMLNSTVKVKYDKQSFEVLSVELK